MQFHMGRQLRFHLNLIRVLSAAHSRRRADEEWQQQTESKCYPAEVQHGPEAAVPIELTFTGNAFAR